MNGSIRLHPEHGVNPTIGVCFWCEQDKNEVLLLGASSKRMTGHEKAPQRLISNYDPCDACKAKIGENYWLIECTEKPRHEKVPPMPAANNGQQVYPTGRWLVIRYGAFENPEHPLHAIHKPRRAYIDPGLFEVLETQGKAANDSRES